MLPLKNFKNVEDKKYYKICFFKFFFNTKNGVKNVISKTFLRFGILSV